QVAVDQVRLEIGLDQGHDNDDLIDVGDEDVFAAAGSPCQQAVAGLHAVDEAFVGAGGFEPDPVAGGDDAAFFGRKGAQEPAQSAFELFAVFGFNNALQAVDAEDAARNA